MRTQKKKQSRNRVHHCGDCYCDGDEDLSPPPPDGSLKKIIKKMGFQAAMVLVFFVVYKVFKSWLPKKFRLKENTIKNSINTLTEMISYLPNEEDPLSNSIEKAYNIFNFLFWKGRIRGSYHNDFREYIEDLDEEVMIYRSDVFAQTIFPKIEDRAVDSTAKQLLDEEGTAKIFKYSFLEGGQTINLYLIRYSQESDTGRITYDPLFAVTKGFNYRKLVNILFQITNNRLYLFLNRRNEIDAEKLSHENNSKNFQLDEGFANSLMEEIEKFKARGLQRSYIFFGPPGTGKTTTALELSKMNSDGKILKLDYRVFERLSSNATKNLIENMDCNYIIVDDIDRMHSGAISNFLYTLEAIKDYENKPTLIATANNLDVLNSAILRPGRFDEILEFNLPNESRRKEIISFLASDLGFELSSSGIQQLAKATHGLSQAYIKEYCQQLANGEPLEKVKGKIKFRKELIENPEKRKGEYSEVLDEEVSEATNDDENET